MGLSKEFLAGEKTASQEKAMESGKENSGKENSGKEGSGKEGSGKECSGKEGSGKEGNAPVLNVETACHVMNEVADVVGYDKKVYNISQVEKLEDIVFYINCYASKMSYEIASSLKQALIDRANGKKSLSIREADICCRGKLNPTNSLLMQQALSDSVWGAFLTESILEDEVTVWDLRTRYNNGLLWKKTKADAATQEQRDKGNQMMQDILDQLRDLGLPAYDIEVRLGFLRNLCKPEFMEWPQYEHDRANNRLGLKSK